MAHGQFFVAHFLPPPRAVHQFRRIFRLPT